MEISSTQKFSSKDEIVNFLKRISEELELRVTSVSNINSCFDMILYSQHVFFLKVYENINSLTRDVASSLKVLATMFSANSFVIAQSDNNKNLLSNDTIYIRYGLPVFSPIGFYNFLRDNNHEFCEKYKREKFRIDSKKLRTLRRQFMLSYARLSDHVNISSKMLYLYEHGKVLISREKLERLERFFNEKLRTPIKGSYSSSNQVATNDNVDNLLLSHKVNLFSLEFYACSSPIDLTNTNGVDIIGIAYSSDRHTDRKLAHVLKEMRDSLDNFIPAFYRPSSKVDSYRQIAVIDSEEVRENPSLISLSKVIKEKCTKL